MKGELTVAEALKQGYEYFVYANGDQWQSLGQISDTKNINWNSTPMITEKEGIPVSIPSAEDLADLISEHIQGQWDDETGDDTNDVSDAIKSIDFTDLRQKMEVALADKHYYRSSGIKLIP